MIPVSSVVQVGAEKTREVERCSKYQGVNKIEGREDFVASLERKRLGGVEGWEKEVYEDRALS